MVQVRFRALALKYILEMIRAKWAAIFPLRVTSAIPFANCNPMMLANRVPRFSILSLEPRNDQGRFRFELTVRYVVIRQRAVKRILAWNKRDRNVVAPRGGLGIVETAIITRPVCVP